MSDFRCPHCRTSLPERAPFCSACGRRIEGWSSAPKEATPALGESALPDGELPTRQMDVTPSLLRAVALSRRRGESQRARKRPGWLLALGMLVVAVAGGTIGFLAVHAHKRRLALAHAHAAAPPIADDAPAEEPAFGPEPAPAAAPSSAVEPAAAPTAPPPVAKSSAPLAKSSPAVAAPKPGRAPQPAQRAHRIAAVTVPVAAAPTPPPRRQKVAPGGLPHKAVATDSQSITQQQQREARAVATQAQLQLPAPVHETTAAAAPDEASQKSSAEAALDADSIRLVVRQHLPQVRACYNRAFKDTSPGGTVEIGLAIDHSGRAQNVRTETNTTDSPELARCLETRVREWQFPRPVGDDYELIYPFVFAPGS